MKDLLLSPSTTAKTALESSCQLLVVLAPTWQSDHARLQRFERSGPELTWLPAGAALDVMIGRAGLAWGRGVPAEDDVPGGQKREGDGCAPAGVFAITSLFGEAGPGSDLARAAKLPYLCATADLKAIDDPASAHYNHIVDQTAVTPDWTSCEDMRRSDGRYAIGAVVAYNSEPVAPGAGSCIFMHVWERAGIPTAGCTAMALADMMALAGWFDASAAPLLVQLPLAEYEARRSAWGLPALAA